MSLAQALVALQQDVIFVEIALTKTVAGRSSASVGAHFRHNPEPVRLRGNIFEFANDAEKNRKIAVDGRCDLLGVRGVGSRS
jgi:hypothetical protein